MMNLSTVIAHGYRYCTPPIKQLLNYTAFLPLPHRHHLHLQRRSPSSIFYSSFNNLKLFNFNLLLTGNPLFFRMEVPCSFLLSQALLLFMLSNFFFIFAFWVFFFFLSCDNGELRFFFFMFVSLLNLWSWVFQK